jgi:hypothetical protein
MARIGVARLGRRTNYISNEGGPSLAPFSVRVDSNLSFTATFSKRKPLIFLEKVGGLWFLASEKRPYGTEMGLVRYFGAEIRASRRNA